MRIRHFMDFVEVIVFCHKKLPLGVEKREDIS